MVLCLITVQGNSLIADYASLSISRCRINPVRVNVGLRPCYKKCPGLMQSVQTVEIDVTTIHDLDGARVGDEQIERMNIVEFTVGNMDKAWYVAPQVKQSMHLHRGFRRTKARPWKHRQTQINGRRVESVD